MFHGATFPYVCFDDWKTPEMSVSELEQLLATAEEKETELNPVCMFIDTPSWQASVLFIGSFQEPLSLVAFALRSKYIVQCSEERPSRCLQN